MTTKIDQVTDGTTVDQPPAGCSRCSLGPDPGSGRPRWAAHVDGKRPNGSTYAVRCSCARGAWLARKDAENRSASGFSFQAWQVASGHCQAPEAFLHCDDQGGPDHLHYIDGDSVRQWRPSTQ